MCPATESYLTPYIDRNNRPIRIDDRVASDVEKNARNVLALAKRGAKVIFPDVFSIYHGLEQQLLMMPQDLLYVYLLRLRVSIPKDAAAFCLSIIYQIVQDDFFCPVMDAVHAAHPLHLVSGF